LKAIRINDLTIVSPDAGGAERARFLARSLDANLAIVDKRRPEANVSEVMNIIGDVKDRNCILVDDMVDTGGSISKACIALKECGALDVYCLFTHAVLSGDAVAKMHTAGFKEIITTNTIPIKEEVMIQNLTILSVAPLIGEAIRRIHNGESISSLLVKL
jgi:ribose-phosphate pyrophosphokinase